MTEKIKINRLETFDIETFKEVFLDILQRIGYINIETNADSKFISADEKSALKTNTHVFYLTTNSLSGKDEDNGLIKDVSNKLISYSEENKNYAFFIISTQYISKGFEKKLLNHAIGISIDFKGRDELIGLIDEYNKDFWKHDDRILINYENDFIESLEEDTELKKLKIFDEKYDKVLKIFIEPRMYSIQEDLESGEPTRQKINLLKLCESRKSKIITGDAGAGKSTLLKKIGEKYVKTNREKGLKIKNLPILISVLDFIDNNFDLTKILKDKTSPYFNFEIDELSDNYNVILLIDTIDEFTDENQKLILEQLNTYAQNKKLIYKLATRNSEQIQNLMNDKSLETLFIDKFNQEQIRNYIENFFPSQNKKAESLLDALRDNRILERLPITPLTLSLVSILYEERNFEIPATIADIYDNFNHLLLGKATISSRIEFIDISFSERILSLYGFELLHRDNHLPMTKDEFITFFEKYFQGKSSSLGSDTLKNFLAHLANNSGILEFKDNKYVQFKHNSFLEYYSALEYFRHRRTDEYENEIVDNFFDPIWQNTAIFYGGMSKDMPEFLTKIINKVKSANKFPNYFASVNGLGYLLQALYQTDNEIRKLGIQQAVETNLEAYELFKKLAQDEQVLFKNHKLPILALINLTFFYENFNSIALKHPLEMTFQDYFEKYKLDKDDGNNGYRALKIALTLNSPRLNSIQSLEKLIDETDIVSNPYLSLIAHFAISLNEGTSTELKKELRKSFNKNKEAIKELQSASVHKIRFSPLDTIHPNRKVKLIVEGKTDVQILEHAYIVLKDGERPYWNIFSPKHSSNARAVGDVINSSITTINSDEIVVGIMDNDHEGQGIFNGHLKQFSLLSDCRIKKADGVEVYALRLPIPQRLKHYFSETQSMNFFELEHYFPNEFLEKHDMIKNTPIPNVFEIKDKKTSFMKTILKEHNKEVFRDFIDIFRLIDSITKEEIEY